MELTRKEAFQLGFLKRAAERGVTPSEAVVLVKRANSLWPLLTGGALIGIGIPAAIGVGTGSLHAQMEDVSKKDVARLKKKQLLDTLRMEATAVRDRIRRQKEKPTYQL